MPCSRSSSPRKRRPSLCSLQLDSRFRGNERRSQSRTRVIDELLRRPLAPLRPQRFLGGNEIGAVGEIETIAVGPVLVHASPRIGPVVVDLAAEHVPANAPHVLVLAGLFE